MFDIFNNYRQTVTGPIRKGEPKNNVSSSVPSVANPAPEASAPVPEAKAVATPAPETVAKPTAVSKNTDASIRVVKEGETLSSIADSRNPDMKQARAEVRNFLGKDVDNKTVLGVLSIALANNIGKENINQIDAGDTITKISGDQIKAVVQVLKETGKLEGSRLALGNETTLTEIFTPKDTPKAVAGTEPRNVAAK